MNAATVLKLCSQWLWPTLSWFQVRHESFLPFSSCSNSQTSIQRAHPASSWQWHNSTWYKVTVLIYVTGDDLWFLFLLILWIEKRMSGLIVVIFFLNLFSAFLFLDCDKASSHCVISVLMFEMSRHLAGLFLSKWLRSPCLVFSPSAHVTKACDVLRSIEEFKHKAGMVRPSPPPSYSSFSLLSLVT